MSLLWALEPNSHWVNALSSTCLSGNQNKLLRPCVPDISSVVPSLDNSLSVVGFCVKTSTDLKALFNIKRPKINKQTQIKLELFFEASDRDKLKQQSIKIRDEKWMCLKWCAPFPGMAYYNFEIYKTFIWNTRSQKDIIRILLWCCLHEGIRSSTT